MSQPRWITPVGSLGTIAEESFFSTVVRAVDPDGNPVNYQFLAGELPAGMQLKSNGEVVGVPLNTDYDEITKTFVVRATNGISIADRTFSLTVVGQTLPRFMTAAGTLGFYYDGEPADYQLQFSVDSLPKDVELTIVSGQLPPGLSISSQGLISGVIIPDSNLPSNVEPGYDLTAFDLYPFDFISQSISKNYEFTLRLFNGQTQVTRTYSMYVVSRASLTADTTIWTADNNYLTADEMPYYTPYITNYPENGYIGTYRHDNFFAYQFQGAVYGEYNVDFDLVALEMPPSLAFNTNTGWLYGYLDNQGLTEKTWEFEVRIYNADNPSYISNPYRYSMKTVGNIENEVTWLNASLTPTTDGSIDLGSIKNGATSLFQILAATSADKKLFFRLKSGVYYGPEEVFGYGFAPYDTIPYDESIDVNTYGQYNLLPQGLELLSSGNISGRVSFNTFALDGGTTTFDMQRTSGLEPKETTFDLTFRFTVEAYTYDGSISVFKTFTIKVVRAYQEPYESLYMQAMPSLADREMITDLLQDTNIMEPSLIFRADDPYFGVSQRVVYTHAYGLKASTLNEYYQALELNHFRKMLTLGELKVAQALDENENVLYDVVYSEIVDTGVNGQGESPPQFVPVPYPFVDITDGSTLVKYVYPNSLIEMRNQVIDTVGQYGEILPLWMTTKQASGRILGFTKAWVIAYANPGKGNQLKYNIETRYTGNLNKVDFDVDRYTLDRQETKNWIVDEDGPGGGNWITAQTTTFDVLQHYQLTPVIYTGSGYAPGDRVKILGSQLNGTNGVNDISITVSSVGASGEILTAVYNGVVGELVNVSDYFNDISSVTLTGSGTGALFDISITQTSQDTTFDDNSLQFNSPVDMYDYTDKYNKYLVFPKTNILN